MKSLHDISKDLTEDEINAHNICIFIEAVSTYTAMLEQNVEESLEMLNRVFDMLRYLDKTDSIKSAIDNSKLHQKLFSLLSSDFEEIGESSLKNILMILNKSIYKDYAALEIYSSDEFLTRLCEIIDLDESELTKICLSIISQLASYHIEEYSFPEIVYHKVSDIASGDVFETKRAAFYIIGQVSSSIDDESRIVKFAELFMNSLKTEFIANKIQNTSYLADICKRFPDIRASLVDSGLIDILLTIMKDLSPSAERFVDYTFEILFDIAENGSNEELERLYKANTIHLLLIEYNLLDNDNPLGQGTKDPQKYVLTLIILLLGKENPTITQAIFECDIVNKAFAMLGGNIASFNDEICCFMFHLLTMKRQDILDEMIQLDALQVIFSNMSCHIDQYIVLCLRAVESILDLNENYKDMLISINVLSEIEEILEANPSEEASQIGELLIDKLE